MNRLRLTFLAFALALAVATPSLAQVDAVGLQVGYVDVKDFSDGVAFNGFVDLWTGEDHVALELFVDYWKQTSGPESSQAKARDFSFGGLVRYLLGERKVVPYAGVGFGIHFVKTENPGVIGPVDPVTKVKAGLHLGGGLAADVHRSVQLRAEGWYVISDIEQWTVRAGAGFRL